MATNVHKTAMPTAAGILSIISGAGHIIGFLVLLLIGIFWTAARNYSGYDFSMGPAATTVFVILAIIALVFGVISIVGGVYTLQRKRWGWALTAAILAFLPFNLLGLAAIILVALSKREFDWVNMPSPPNPPTPPVNPPANPPGA